MDVVLLLIHTTKKNKYKRGVLKKMLQLQYLVIYIYFYELRIGRVHKYLHTYPGCCFFFVRASGFWFRHLSGIRCKELGENSNTRSIG